MQRRRARDLSALASDTAEACLIRALARPNASKVLSQLSQDIIAMCRCAQEAVSRESRRVRTGCVGATLRLCDLRRPLSVGVRSFRRALEALPVPLEKGKQSIDSKCGAAEQVWMGSRAGA